MALVSKLQVPSLSTGSLYPTATIYDKIPLLLIQANLKYMVFELDKFAKQKIYFNFNFFLSKTPCASQSGQTEIGCRNRM